MSHPIPQVSGSSGGFCSWEVLVQGRVLDQGEVLVQGKVLDQGEV